MPPAMTLPLIIGVTGAIASGKSLLCRRLADAHGARHVDADKQVHLLYEPGTPAFDRIVARFGEDVIGGDGAIDRKILGGKVFGKPDELQALRDAIGDLEAHFIQLLEDLRRGPDAIAVFEAVRLMEGPYQPLCDESWLVATSDETALRRLMQRNDLDEAEARQRMASAVPWQDRAPKADRIFHNDGPIEDLQAQADQALAAALAERRPA